MLKKLKKGVKRVMKEVNNYVNDSLAVRVYENTREDLKQLFESCDKITARVYENTREDLKQLFESCDKITAGLLSIGLGVGIGIPLLLSGYLENSGVLYKEC